MRVSALINTKINILIKKILIFVLTLINEKITMKSSSTSNNQKRGEDMEINDEIIEIMMEDTQHVDIELDDEIIEEMIKAHEEDNN